MADKQVKQIQKELVGVNPRYKVLQAPKKPAYPDGFEVRYSDDYLAQLNRSYSLNEILGNAQKGIAKRDTDTIAGFVMGSPLENSEGEDILASMLISSAQAGTWQPMIIDVPRLTDTKIRTAEEYLDRIKKISPRYHIGMMHGGVVFGISVAERGDFALPIAYENKVIVVPSQEFVEYCQTQRR